MQRTPLVVAALLSAALAACAADSAQGPRVRSLKMAASGAPPGTTYHCASPQPGQPLDCGWREEPDAETTVCKEEKVTGSNISRTVCRSRDEAFREDAVAREWMNAWPANPMRVESVHVGSDPFRHVYPE